jgi:hypothetical protein
MAELNSFLSQLDDALEQLGQPTAVFRPNSLKLVAGIILGVIWIVAGIYVVLSLFVDLPALFTRRSTPFAAAGIALGPVLIAVAFRVFSIKTDTWR